MPPTRREQLELDELLSDIYRGIEALPDKQQHQNTWAATSNKSANSSSSSNNNNVLFAHSYVKEYELPGTSPIVRRHKQEIAKLRSEPPTSEHGLSGGAYYDSSKQPARSTLKRHTPDPYQSRKQPAHQQLAEQDLYGSQRTPTTPDNKRRVRIVDHRDNRNDNDGYSDYTDNYADDFASSSGHEQHQLAQQTNKPQGKVKYVNTNKFIYHQERNPEDRRSSDSEQEQDNVDGVTRVEYYHTTWLDRQLGRASKRRSSKELNERQVKEKAMIEELKRSLKNGAITLRQSLRGGRKHKDQLETFDDQILDAPAHTSSANRYKQESVFGSGLATIPRNYNKQSRGDSNSPRNKHNHTMNHSSTILHPQYAKPATPKQTTTTNTATTTTTTAHSPFDSVYRPVTEGHDQHLPTPMQTTNTSRSSVEASANYSRTLPHNYHHQQKPHSLLQSHLRGGSGASKVYSNPNTSTTSYTTRTTTLPPNCSSDFSTNSMRNPQYQQQQQRQHSNGYTTGHVDSTNTTHHQHYSTSTYDPATPSQHQAYHQASTISSIPSATEVVRSALSRSSSQVSLNQLNKTINLLPSSPTMDGASPMTPTKHLRPASPSLSPSPVAGIGQQHQRAHSDLTCSTRHPAGQPGTAGRLQQERHPDGTIVLHGTRTIAAAPQPAHIQQQQQQHGQPIYANPHASFIQHRAEQQMRQPGKSQASIREFNELDSLLRSLSPHGSSVHVTPGYSSRPAQGPIGFDYAPPTSSASGMVQPAVAAKPGSDIYARVQKPPQQQQTAASMYGASQPRQPLQQQQQHYAQGNIQTDTNQPFTIDVTSKRDDDCLKRQDLSEFEPPFELLPSMEDYQNITKLNPVKNHYWYKPNMSRDRAISLLKDKPQGTFIVRDSTSFRGAYGLAVKVSKLPKNVLNNASLRNPNGDPSAEYIRHFLIEPTSNGVRLKGYANEPVFGSLPSLIYQHSLTELALPCKLVIPRADIEDPHFNHKQKQFYDEFLISKEQAKHGPYERTTPMGGYRKYPGDVYVHNEHRIIFE